ncbi:MAG: hypothetical protein C5B56_00845 [Proteobacteria bacterium]|nr:MAG: hypothetical protein C5B56_00845 [Pseudomonadota bacterium]
MRHSIWTIALGAAIIASTWAPETQAFDNSKYPDWAGQWRRPAGVGNQWDTRKPRLGQQPPLTPEYQAIYDANLADQNAGGQGTDPTFTCIPDGMPRAMNVIFPMEIVIQPHITHMIIEYLSMLRRIYTDGRDWPAEVLPSFMGYSIGRWVDEDGDGRYDALLIETRHLKGPRSFDASGIPLHADDETVVKERLYLDKTNPDILHNDVTTIDHALTRPWTVTKNYQRVRNPVWVEAICAEGNQHVKVGADTYMLSADGHLMPTKKGQAPPDLRYFGQGRK